MAVTTATLGGVTLPHVADDGFDESYGYRGADREMLDGSVHTALVTTTAKRRFELRWREVTESQIATLQSAFATVRDGNATFVTPRGGSYTVTRDVGFFELDIKWKSRRQVIKATSVTLKLREV